MAAPILKCEVFSTENDILTFPIAAALLILSLPVVPGHAGQLPGVADKGALVATVVSGTGVTEERAIGAPIAVVHHSNPNTFLYMWQSQVENEH